MPCRHTPGLRHKGHDRLTIERNTFLTDIPARLDRLAWSSFHGLILAALGITWILDGLEVTIVGSLSGALQSRAGLGLAHPDRAFRQYLCRRRGGGRAGLRPAGRSIWRRKPSSPSRSASISSPPSPLGCRGISPLCVFRVLTGAGIGGEYSAINSAIQEFTPARLRGRVDLLVNGSYWIGAALGALGSLVVLDPALVPAAWAGAWLSSSAACWRWS